EWRYKGPGGNASGVHQTRRTRRWYRCIIVVSARPPSLILHPSSFILERVSSAGSHQTQAVIVGICNPEPAIRPDRDTRWPIELGAGGRPSVTARAHVAISGQRTDAERRRFDIANGVIRGVDDPDVA